MPVTTPSLDDRTYRELLDEALARIPVHNPEWTNFNDSDPGVTLVQVFSFLTESLLYRANQIPERNRRKFLQLLGAPIRSATSARGMVAFTNARGPLETITLAGDLEVLAGRVPFRTRTGLDVLPIETAVFYKRPLPNPDPRVLDYYRQLHASFLGSPLSAEVRLYETATLPSPMNGTPASGLDLGTDTMDQSLWIALLARKGDTLAGVRSEIAGKTVSLGVIPDTGTVGAVVVPGAMATGSDALLQYQIPVAEPLSGARVPRYVSLPTRTTTNVLAEPGIVQIDLPMAEALHSWDNMEPLEAGTGDFPPDLEDTALKTRLITWLRVRLPASDPGVGRSRRNQPRIRWTCLNAALVDQRDRITSERLPDGTGEPDQSVFLAQPPVIPETVRISISRGSGAPRRMWTETDDMLAASPEGPVDDSISPDSQGLVLNPGAHVFTVNAESGEVRFGDGLRGRRPPFGAHLTADYDSGHGRAGNVVIGAIGRGPTLPAVISVANPIPTWGGDTGETVAEGEKQIARFLQHRERLVTREDFSTVTWRTPGVDVGRVEVLPAFNPELSPNEPGDAPGAVTILAIPKFDPFHPNEPEPDQFFLSSICEYLAPRRLVTTELHVRGPNYVPLWISVGFEPTPGESVGEVREAIKRAIRAFLAPLPDGEIDGHSGWPLRKAVADLELWAVANRVPGVSLVSAVLLAEGGGAAVRSVDLVGLELPAVMGIEARQGDPLSIESMRNQIVDPGPEVTVVAVPVVPEECR